MAARSILGCLILLFAALTPAAWAKPEHTSFKDMMDQSETIVVAALAEPLKPGSSTVQLNVLQVLKGSLKPGKREVILRDDPCREARQFVVFLDKQGVWRFMAVPVFGKPVAIDVLEVRGFSRVEVHYVTPGLVTLTQLKTYLKDKSLRYVFRGDLYFPQSGSTFGVTPVVSNCVYS
ncbi:MAG TPA: hypothetical protein VMR25_09605 [Planctomycetaceae bacterium]|jgi:hypothetical protein|nr:hypothetical protein [Planctomycetaceae bacterium]